MKNIVSANRIRNFIASFLAIAVFTTSSAAALAANNRLMGELTIVGVSGVSINGERAASGRSVSSSSVIATSADSTALINLGATGKIELAPGSSLSLSFDDKTISGKLNEGNVKIAGAPGVAVKLAAKNGEVTNGAAESSFFSVDSFGKVIAENGTFYFNDGKTVTQTGGQTGGTQQPDNNKTTELYIPLGIALGAVATALIIVAASGDDDNDTILSPIR